MSTFTVDEIKEIVAAPMVASLAVAAADIGIFSTAIEATAMAKELTGAAQRYPNNPIIQAAFAPEVLKNQNLKPEAAAITPEDVQSGAVVSKAVAAINTSLGVLTGKASEAEIGEYKAFIYHCAEAVASAAGSGLFGSGDPKVSDKETAVLTQLKITLGV